jgi:hypothetical protein
LARIQGSVVGVIYIVEAAAGEEAARLGHIVLEVDPAASAGGKIAAIAPDREEDRRRDP